MNTEENQPSGGEAAVSTTITEAQVVAWLLARCHALGLRECGFVARLADRWGEERVERMAFIGEDCGVSFASLGDAIASAQKNADRRISELPDEIAAAERALARLRAQLPEAQAR